MSRISTHLTAIETWLKALTLDGKPLVKDCKRQLDLVDAEDVSKLSFTSPGGFLVLPRFRLVARADGGKDCEIWIVMAIAVKATAGKSADAEAIDRAIALAAALDNADFGQLSTSEPAEIECRPVLQAALETKGIAIAAVTFRQLLYALIPAREATQGLIGMTGPDAPGAPVEFSIADGNPTPDEQTIIAQWGAGA